MLSNNPFYAKTENDESMERSQTARSAKAGTATRPCFFRIDKINYCDDTESDIKSSLARFSRTSAVASRRKAIHRSDACLATDTAAFEDCDKRAEAAA